VSRLWPERLSVSLEPHRVMVGTRAVDADPDYGAEPWHGALEVFKREAATWRSRLDVSVLLSNHFVRYAVLPAQDGSATLEEELALARFQFTKIHGERVKAWEVRVSEQLACAIDTALLSEIKGIFSKQKGVKLVSVQPYLMAAYNRTRRRIPAEGAWLVLAETGRTCLARLAPKGWASVHNGRETDAEALLERERSRASGERLPALVLREQL
jgi:hypothetical protein